MDATLPLWQYAGELSGAVQMSRDEFHYSESTRQTLADYAAALLDCYEIEARDEFGRPIARLVTANVRNKGEE